MSEEQARKEAAELFKAAEGHLKAKSVFFGLFSSGPSYFEAVDAYLRAGNVLKAAKLWRESGDAFVKAGEVEIQAGEIDASARKFLQAGQCYKKVDPQLAVDCLKKAVETLVRGGRFHVAATHEKEIAEIYEQNVQDLPAAIKYYLQAADRFQMEDSTAIAQGCTAKAAALAAESEEYAQAAELFEGMAEASASDAIRKYAVKDFLLRAGLCRLCLDDVVGAKKAIDRYSTLDGSFGASKEFVFLNEIVACLENGDADQFTEIVSKWDRTNAVDEWKTRVLLRLKRHMEAEPSLT